MRSPYFKTGGNRTVGTPDAVITIIIPTYRRPALLKRAILSAIGQTYKNIRISVYDNASDDETGEVVSRLQSADPRINYYCHDANIGPLRNFQFAMSRIDTPYFIFLSDDDFLLPGFCERGLSFFRANKLLRVYSGVALGMNPDGRIRLPRQEKRIVPGLHAPCESLRLLTTTLMRNWGGMVFDSTLIKEIGPLDLDLAMHHDVAWVLRALARHPAYFDKELAVVLCLHEGSASNAAEIGKLWDDWKLLVSKISLVELPAGMNRSELITELRSSGAQMIFNRTLLETVTRGRMDSLQVAREALLLAGRRNRLLNFVLDLLDTPIVGDVCKTVLQSILWGRKLVRDRSNPAAQRVVDGTIAAIGRSELRVECG